ncbi:MAG: PD40 domain-containing protein [Anaerolineales bacterium]|nr:PD40 domain-containing protein [Anaerolineales bacterium]
MPKLALFSVFMFVFFTACVANSQLEPGVESAAFPENLVAPVKLPEGLPLVERQIAYCEFDLSLGRPQGEIKITSPLGTSGFYVESPVPAATNSDIGCLGPTVFGLDWSPDGKALLFNLGPSVPSKSDVDTNGQPVNSSVLLNPPKYTFYDFAHAPTWSPQGNLIAFISKFQEGPGQIGEPPFAPSLFISESDGSDPRFFVQEQTGGGISSYPVWSHDGTRVAYMLSLPANGMGILDVESGEVTYFDAQNFYEIPQGVLELHGIRPRDSIAWLPGDKIILFLTNSESETEDILWRVEVESGNLTKMYQANIKQIALSPDGKTLALITAEGFPEKHMIKTLSLTDEMRLQNLVTESVWENATNQEIEIRDLAWSLDGRYLAFAADPDNNFDLFVWDTQTTEFTQLTHTPNLAEFALAWRPSLETDN